MQNRLIPNIWYERLWQIPVNDLVDIGIKGVIVDLDNTLVPWKKDPSYATIETREWLKRLESAGIDVCIVSNGGSSRVQSFAAELGIKAVAGVPKPRRTPFRKAMSLMGTSPTETAVVGDQLFTDILGGNRSGCYTVLVTPHDEKEFFYTKIVRILERRIKKRLQSKGQFPERKGKKA
ncbi:MAG: YqeG family HAD IIIA-type phosphatase [Firmicutes bacterium]|nr:YqeG family HAD IIIA-type phosphatase [Bacillota bacterium]MDD4264554.1 YqeG family HAD IIIA-type phosphatase [Bacillota bacterium]MDD4694397.1 YqeG family HAD IIIA-type phosphatase [Bacillota bacterium]